jgi:hypothetical protein
MTRLKKNTKPNIAGTTTNASTHVPGQHLGHSLQETRFVMRLLQVSDEWTVSIEVFDDVGVEAANGSRIAEQDKSTLEDNPISDRAIGLWKTLSNWINAINSGELDVEKTKFDIYVSRPKKGEIAESFSRASSITEALVAIRNAREKLWGASPSNNYKDRLPETIKEYVNNFLGADEVVACKLIVAFSLLFGSGSPQSDLRELMKNQLIDDDLIDDVMAHAQGWVKNRIDLLLEQKKPASIPKKEFKIELVSYIKRTRLSRILISVARDPEQGEIEENLRLKTYIRQLEIISCDDVERIRAVNDFIRASTNRTRWSEQGIVHRKSFDEFEEGLIRAWENYKRKTSLLSHLTNDSDRGKNLYSDCSLHQTTLQGMDVPPHFIPGSYHSLSDKEIIGWHPNYKDELKLKGEE